MDEKARIKESLLSVIKGKVLDDEAALTHASTDASIFEVRPSLVVVPEDKEDIQNIVKKISDLKQEGMAVSISARSAGTCMSGGSLTESVVIDMVSHINKIGEVDEKTRTILIEPGAYYRDMEAKTEAANLLMPAYTASKKICTVGGMVANNSSGELTLSHGSTKNYVRKLKMVLGDGNEYEIKPLEGNELREKMESGTYVGAIYKKIFDLIKNNKEMIKAAAPAVSKNSAGYFLWEVLSIYEDTGIFDLTRLISGSQGTLGIITEIEFALVPIPKYKKLLAITLKDFEIVPDVVTNVLSFHPYCFESYDDHTFDLAQKYIPDDTENVITRKDTVLTLIAVFAGDNENEVGATVSKAYASIMEHFGHTHLEAEVVDEDVAEKSYWNIRRSSFALLRDHGDDHHRAVPFIDDFVVIPEKLHDFLPELRALLKEYELTYTIAGHIGNGNFHLIPLIDMSDPRERKKILDISQKVFALVFKYKGSMTGEHNDGIIRTPFVGMMFGEKVELLFEEVKKIFDPLNIFNPGKKVGGTLDFAMKHISVHNISEHL